MPTFSFGCDFMMVLGKPQLHAKFEATGFIYSANIVEFVFFLQMGQSRIGKSLIF